MKMLRIGMRAERALALLMLCGAVVFALNLLWPIMAPGYARGGDDVIHMAYSHEAAEIMAREHKLFGWSYLFGFGAPAFLFRPPLQYMIVGFVHNLSGGRLPISAIHKFCYVFFIGMYPAGIYYLLHKFRFKPLACGLGALFAITPISMWGHTLHAYFWLGVMKQLMAIFIFPFALGKVHGCVSRGERALPASVLIALCFLSHPYMPYSLFLVCCVYGLVVLIGSGWRRALLVGMRLAVIWALALLLLAFYLVPFFTSQEIQQHAFSASWRHAFEVVCETTAMTINHFFRGGLFDTTRWGTFGGGEWGWPDNSTTGRVPMLSVMCLLGILICIRRRRQLNAAVLLLSTCLAFLIFLGPDDVPLLNAIPFMDQFQNIHVIFMLDLFAVCLAGVGAAALLRGLCGGAVGALMGTTGSVPESDGDDRARVRARAGQIALALLLGGGAIAIVYSPLMDRRKVAQRIVRTVPFDSHGETMTRATLEAPVYRSLQKVQEILREPGHPGRFYGSAQDAESTDATRELFAFSILPSLCGRTDIISGFFSAEVAGVNKTVIERFRPRIPGHRNLAELCNIRYFLCASSNRDKLAGVSDYADSVYSDPYWTLWRTRGDYGHFAVVQTLPILVYANTADWRRLCYLWLEAFKETANPARFPYFVRADATGGALLAPDITCYAGALVLDAELLRDPAERAALAALVATGSPVSSAVDLGDLAVRRINVVEEIPLGERNS